jgi:MHS family shikimate/dehydroshikimate transporter-like MFS transporter
VVCIYKENNVQRKYINKITFASAFGTFFEWYDFLIYGTAAALVFNKIFFPNIDPVAGMLAAILTWSMGFIARPIGAVVFGYFGDKYGRRNTLMATMLLMGLSTFAVGCLPTYADIGIWAAVLLISLRLIQGMAFGGEWSGASLMISENTKNKSGFYGSFIQAGYPAGILAASFIYALLTQLPQDAFMSWGWRIPFWISLVLVVVGTFIRARLAETPVFEQVQARDEVVNVPLKEVLTTHFKTMLTGVGVKITEVTWAYTLTVSFVIYAVNTMGMTRSDVMNNVFVAATIMMFAIPMFGYLADRIGHRTFYKIGAVVSAMIAYPVFYLLSVGDLMPAMILGLVFGGGFMMAPLAAYLPSLFAANVRYTGSSLSNQIAAAIGGGIIPSISAWVISVGGLTAISLLMIALSAITLGAVLVSRPVE